MLLHNNKAVFRPCICYFFPGAIVMKQMQIHPGAKLSNICGVWTQHCDKTIDLLLISLLHPGAITYTFNTFTLIIMLAMPRILTVTEIQTKYLTKRQLSSFSNHLRRSQIWTTLPAAQYSVVPSAFSATSEMLCSRYADSTCRLLTDDVVPAVVRPDELHISLYMFSYEIH